MNNVKKIIELMGGFERLKVEPIQLTVEGFMPLNIEYIGKGPRGGLLLSIMHFYTQHGDLMRDPDLVVEILAASDEWLPISYRQDSIGLYEEAVSIEGTEVVERSQLVKDLKHFMDLWDRNIADQGFVERARFLVRPEGESPSTPAVCDDTPPEVPG